MPAEVIDDREARQGARIVQNLAEIGLELRLRPFLAALGDEVFEPRMLAVAAVAVITVLRVRFINLPLRQSGVS